MLDKHWQLPVHGHESEAFLQSDINAFHNIFIQRIAKATAHHTLLAMHAVWSRQRDFCVICIETLLLVRTIWQTPKASLGMLQHLAVCYIFRGLAKHSQRLLRLGPLLLILHINAANYGVLLVQGLVWSQQAPVLPSESPS